MVPNPVADDRSGGISTGAPLRAVGRGGRIHVAQRPLRDLRALPRRFTSRPPYLSPKGRRSTSSACMRTIRTSTTEVSAILVAVKLVSIRRGRCVKELRRRLLGRGGGISPLLRGNGRSHERKDRRRRGRDPRRCGLLRGSASSRIPSSDLEFLSLGGMRITWRRPVSPTPSAPTFADVPDSHPFSRFIEALAASGITGGCGDGSNYCPDAALTRGQMAVFLAKALGLHWGE